MVSTSVVVVLLDSTLPVGGSLNLALPLAEVTDKVMYKASEKNGATVSQHSGMQGHSLSCERAVKCHEMTGAHGAMVDDTTTINGLQQASMTTGVRTSDFGDKATAENLIHSAVSQLPYPPDFETSFAITNFDGTDRDESVVIAQVNLDAKPVHATLNPQNFIGSSHSKEAYDCAAETPKGMDTTASEDNFHCESCPLGIVIDSPGKESGEQRRTSGMPLKTAVFGTCTGRARACNKVSCEKSSSHKVIVDSYINTPLQSASVQHSVDNDTDVYTEKMKASHKYKVESTTDRTCKHSLEGAEPMLMEGGTPSRVKSLNGTLVADSHCAVSVKGAVTRLGDLPHEKECNASMPCTNHLNSSDEATEKGTCTSGEVRVESTVKKDNQP